jgi:hypothetical protein
VSEQQAEQIQGEAGSAGAAEAAPEVSVSGKPFGTTGPAAAEIESPRIAPDQEETTPKPDAAKIEAVKVEPAKAEAAKAEAAKAETAKAEAAKAEAAKIEAAKIEAVKPEPPRIGALKPEVASFEAPKAEAPKAEAPKFETLKTEAPKIEVARADAPKKAEALIAEAPKAEAPKAEAPKIEAANAEVAKGEAAKGEVAKAEVAMAEAAKLGAPKVEASRAASGKVEPPKIDPSKAGAVKPEVRRFPTKPTITTPPGDRSWDKKSGDAKAESGSVPPAPSKRRRFTAIAAVLALAAVAGALGGALATAGLSHFAGQGTADATGSAADPALEASVARIDADILALKAGLEETSKTGASQFNQTGDRLDKIEQALAELANNKLAKFSDAVDKLSTAPPVATNAMAAAPREPKEPKEVTGSVTRPVVATAAPAPVAPPKPQVGRLPTLDGWVLRDVRRGGALIEGRAGLYEVYAGDPVPGLGRVDAIRKQDGRWVVVTTKGIVVAR